MVPVVLGVDGCYSNPCTGGWVGEELRAKVNNAASTACPEDGRGWLVPVVLGVDGSERRPSLRRCLELRLEEGGARATRWPVVWEGATTASRWCGREKSRVAAKE
jgi:hypothetical protein